MSGPNRPDAADDQSRAHRLEFTVDWPPGHAAAYLLAGDEPILIDAGMAGEQGQAELIDGLDSHGYVPENIDHLLLTHSHTDHVGQIEALLEAGDPTVHAPTRIRERFARDIETIEAATRRNLAETGVDPTDIESAVDRLLEAHESNRDALALEAVDVWFDGDEPIRVGNQEFDPIYTPGHHVTHHCYGTTLGDERVVFAGDMAVEPFRAAAIHVNFDDGVRDCVLAFIDALERLQRYDFDRVYPGHGPVHERYHETVERSIADLEDRIDGCADALTGRDGTTTATELADELTDSFGERARVLPEVVGALECLEREGAVRSRLEDGVRYYESP